MVTTYGALATGAVKFSDAYSVTANATNTAFNFVTPSGNQNFIITSIHLYANKNVGANDATVEIYEALAPDTTTVTKTIFTAEMLKQTSRDLTGLNISITASRWLNIKTDDDIIYATVLGYFIDATG
jgi:hypothetical protein